MSRTKITPPELARRWGIDVHKVHAWIKRGELRAIDASERVGVGRPRYLIDEADIAAFEEKRSAAQPRAAKRRTRQAAGVIEF